MAIITDGVKTKFTDDTGLPLIGGQVFSYVEGTSTPKDTYQDRAFTIPNTNPIILDDVGSCQMYLKGGYRLRVLDVNGVLIEEKDNAFQSDGQVLDVVANTTAIAALQTNVDVLNTRGGLKTDENNHIIGQGKAESATVYDLSLRSDKIRVSAPTDVEFGDLVFKTYDAPTVVNGVTIPTGTWLNPALVTPLLGTAATKGVGVSAGQVPLSEQVFAAYNSVNTPITGALAGQDCNLFEVGTRWYVNTASAVNTPPPAMFGGQFYLIETRSLGTGTSGSAIVLFQLATDTFSGLQVTRVKRTTWTDWVRTAKPQDVLSAYYPAVSGVDANNFAVNSGYLVSITGNQNLPSSSGSIFAIITRPHHALSNILRQTAYDYVTGEGYVRTKNVTWTAWRPFSANKSNYTTTTASGANVAVDSTGMLMRSTSSERYKDILAPLELDDARYADAMALKPIVYRSTASADNPAYHYYSFSAEELGAYDPAFTLWRETETVTDEDGNVTEQPLAERQAEGININALLAMGHAIAIKQGELIKKLEARIELLAAQQTTP